MLILIIVFIVLIVQGSSRDRLSIFEGKLVGLCDKVADIRKDVRKVLEKIASWETKLDRMMSSLMEQHRVWLQVIFYW